MKTDIGTSHKATYTFIFFPGGKSHDSTYSATDWLALVVFVGICFA